MTNSQQDNEGRAGKAEYERLLDISARASQRVRETQRELFACVPRSETANRVYARLLVWERIEREARKAVRNHPDHSYEGL